VELALSESWGVTREQGWHGQGVAMEEDREEARGEMVAGGEKAALLGC